MDLKRICPLISSDGLVISVKEFKQIFGISGYKSFLRKFIIRIKSPVGTYYTERKIYRLKDDKLMLPRFCVNKLLDSGIIGRPVVKLQNVDSELEELDFLGEPTHNQLMVANHITENYFSKDMKQKGQCGVTAFMVAGGGKTFLTMYIMSLLKKKTLIIVPNTYLLKQWETVISEFITGASCGVYYGKEKKDGDIVIGIINSFTNKEGVIKFKTKQNKKVTDIEMTITEYCKKFGLVVFDESHLYSTEERCCIYNYISATYVLGLSATPDEREDGTDKISHLNIGPVLDCSSVEGYIPHNNNFVSEVKIIKYDAHPDFCENRILDSTGMISIPLMLEDLTTDPYRNNLIIKEIQLLLSKDDNVNIFVFSDRRAHCEMLQEMFFENLSNDSKEKTSIESKEEFVEVVCTMYGGCGDSIIQQAKKTARIIFTTYAYSSTGVSIEKLTGLVLATPRRSKARQIIGRIFRNKEEFMSYKRYIVDICDINSCLKQQLYKRMPAYKERNADVYYENKHWKEFEY